MRPYLLLTPGPLTTSETVKEAMLSDWCTWDEDYNVGIVEEIRKSLVEMATKHPEEYTSVLMQGSGTYCVEAVLGSAFKQGDKLLIFSNGAYGNRMGVIADRHGIAYDMVAFEETMQVDPEVVEKNLSRHGDVTHVAFVHCETTTGILNPLPELARVVKAHGKKLIVDAMSSFGGVPLDVQELGIDFLISSANKCIQGVPGFGFIIARRSELMACKGVSRSLSARHLRPVGDDGKRAWQVAFHLAYPRGTRLQGSYGRAEGRRGSGSPLCPLLQEPRSIGKRHGVARLQGIVAGSRTVAGHHFVPLS